MYKYVKNNQTMFVYNWNLQQKRRKHRVAWMEGDNGKESGHLPKIDRAGSRENQTRDN